MAGQEPTISGADSQPRSLADFLDRWFIPQRLKNARRRGREFHDVVVRLESLLRRPARLKDFNQVTIRRVLRAAESDGMLKAERDRLELRFISAWRFAHQLGFVSNFATAKPSSLRSATDFTAAPGPDTLSHLYVEKVLPSLRGKSHAIVDICGSAVHKLNVFAGRYVRPDEIDADMIVGFLAWLTESGKSRPYVQNVRYGLSVVMDELRPGVIERKRRDKNAELPAPEPGTLRHLFETRYLPERLIGSTPLSIADYRTTLRRLREMIGRDLLVAELTDSVVANFMSFALAKGCRPVTVNCRFRAPILALWRFARDCGLVDRDPRVKKLKEPRDVPDAWTEDELRRILNATSVLTGEHFGIPAGPFWRALLLVVWWTGIRRGSLFRLTWSDFDEQTGWLHVPGDKMKNRRGQTYRLGDDAVAALAAIRTPDRDAIFPSATCMHWVGRTFNRILELAEISASRRRVLHQLHKLRRSVATHIAARHGVAAAGELLGHSSIDVTRRYVDPAKLPGRDGTLLLPALSQ